MTDSGQALREPQPRGASEPEDRGHVDGLHLFTMNKPAVTVVVKKRRGAAAGSQGEHGGARSDRAPHGGPGPEERRPRVYQVHPSKPTPGRESPPPEEDDLRDAEPMTPDAANTAPAAAGNVPARRRRARRDPAHAPGEVTRIVFETPPPATMAPPAESGPRTFEFIERAEVGYAQVMAELKQLSAEMDRALSARRFRIK